LSYLHTQFLHQFQFHFPFNILYILFKEVAGIGDGRSRDLLRLEDGARDHQRVQLRL
jgi:hypothetical protein